jgi:hypothetical protein
MAGTAKPVIEIKIENDTVNIVSKVSFFNQVISFKLNEPYQQNYEGLEMNVSGHQYISLCIRVFCG